MKKATRTLLDFSPSAKHVIVQKVNFEGATPQSCYQNACKYADANYNERMVVCGWLIGDFLGEKGTSIIPHYWVKSNITGEYFDPTPRPNNDIQKYDYVYDFSIIKHANASSILPPPLRLLANGKLQVMIDVGVFRDLSSLDVAELYALNIDQSKWVL